MQKRTVITTKTKGIKIELRSIVLMMWKMIDLEVKMCSIEGSTNLYSMHLHSRRT